ncbi:hypothetical protein LX69_01947, partial [Breznakibacter xylanolyticus]
MKKFYLLFILLVVSLGVRAQCNGCTMTLSSNSSSNIALTNTDVLCITGGTFTGNITSFPLGARICVSGGAAFNPSSMPNDLAGTIVVASGSSALLPAFSSNKGFRAENHGVVTFNGIVSFNGIGTIVNYVGASMTFSSAFTLSKVGSSFSNSGALTFMDSFTANNSTNLYNYGVISIGGIFSNGSSFVNYGKVSVVGNVTFTAGVGSFFENYCSFVTDGNLANNNTNLGGFKNNGYVFVDAPGKTITNSASCPWFQSSDGVTRGVIFMNRGVVTGSGNYYFTGATTNASGAKFGDDGLGINFYDTGLPAGKIMDTQTVAPHSSVTKNAFTPPVRTDLCTSCEIAVNNGPVAGDDYFVTTQNSAVSGNVLLNDLDPENNVLTEGVSLIAAPSYAASFALSENGLFTYTPQANYYGNDIFIYAVCDDGSPSKCDTASALITINKQSVPMPACENAVAVSTSLSTVPNTYFPGSASVSAGATSISLGAVYALGNQTAITAGDKLLVIQMQGVDINTSNNDSYGDGVVGGYGNGLLFNTNFSAGTYEFVIASNSVSTTGGTLNLAAPLVNGYVNANFSASSGQRRFQVIRVPQYFNLTLAADIIVPAWNGAVGGVCCIQVLNEFNMNGHTIDAKGKGFRGGAGRRLWGNGTTGLNDNDYRVLSTSGVNGSKGEGIAGTPRYVNNVGTLLDTGVEGYPQGSYGQGAPANGGGGGTDGNSGGSNNQNTGGGGGANGGFGGKGGNAWDTSEPYGGEPGAPFIAASASRLVFGGGGGAASTNDGTGTPGSGFASSGAAGGGVVIVYAKSVLSSGTIDVCGADANNTVGNDASGGGGAGGSVLIVSDNQLSNVKVLANGGNGGTNSATAPHGPGGGGGGGIVYATSALNYATRAKGGISGKTADNLIAYGATSGADGYVDVSVTKAQLPSGFLGCFNHVVAGNDNAFTQMGMPVVGNVLWNDFDVQGNDLSFLGIFDPASLNYVSLGAFPVSGIALDGVRVANAGTIAVAANGEYTFSPVADFSGSVNLVYKVADNHVYSSVAFANLFIQVMAKCDDVNDVTPVSDHLITYMGQSISVNVLLNDVDPQGDGLIFGGFVHPSNKLIKQVSGTMTLPGIDRFGHSFVNAGQLVFAADGSCTFTPVSYFVGTVSVDYVVCDNNESGQICKTASLKISIEPVYSASQNYYPSVTDYAIHTFMNTSVAGATLLANARDLNGGQTISVKTTPVVEPLHGAVTILSNGAYTYVPTSDFVGSDRFVFEVCDNASGVACSRGVVYVNVMGVSATVTEQPLDQSVCGGNPVSFNVGAVGTSLEYRWQVSVNQGVTWSYLSNAGGYSGVSSAQLNISSVSAALHDARFRCELTTPCGTKYSDAAILLVDDSEVVVGQQPVNQSVCAGQSTEFSVVASGASLLYQWQVSVNNGVSYSSIVDGVNYEGTSTANLLVKAPAVGMHGYRYRCVVSSGCGIAVNSSAAVLSVGSVTISVVNQPVATTVCVGTPASFSVFATGSGVNYQWQINTGSGWSNLSASARYPEVNQSVLNITDVVVGMSGYQYRCMLSSSCVASSPSSSAVLTVKAAPYIVNVKQTSRCGQGLETLWAEPSSGSVNWYGQPSGGAAIGSGTSFTTLISATTTFYVEAYDNGCRTPNRVAVSAVVSDEVPAVLSHPLSEILCEGAYHQFSVIASANANSFQWQCSTDAGVTFENLNNSSMYEGVNSPSLILKGVLRSMTDYQYRCVVGADCLPAAISNAAVLTVNYPPEIVVAPIRSWVCADALASFSVVATGGVTGYQWQVSTDNGINFSSINNGGIYSGATSATLQLSSASTALNNNQYRCVVTGYCLPAVTTSAAVLVSNNNSLTINANPVNTSACAGIPTSLTLFASGPSLVYQWQINNGGSWDNLTNAGLYSSVNTNTLNISDVSSINNKQFRCVISSSANCIGATNSSTATITLNTVSPTITSQPTDVTLCEGTDASYSATATVPSGTVQYQWQVSGDNGSSWSNLLNSGAYSGANSKPLNISEVPSSMNGNLYRVRVYSTVNTVCPLNSSNASLTVTPLPVAPVSASVSRNNFCADDAGNVVLTVVGGSGTTLQWFAGSCGGASIGTGNALSIASPEVTTTYYARWINSCGVSECVSVDVNVIALAVAPTSLSVDRNNFCANDPDQIQLSAVGGSGTTLQWFSGSCGLTSVGSGDPLSISSPEESTVYYARYQNGCGVSICNSVSVTVNASPDAPVANAVQSFCGSAVLSDLSATAPSGSVVRWYATPVGGAVLSSGYALANGETYYAESYRTATGCASVDRTSVEVLVTVIPGAPVGDASQSFCSTISPTLSDLVVTGDNVKWYSAISGGLPLDYSKLLVNNATYYSSQTWNGCESTARRAVKSILNGCNPFVNLSVNKVSILENSGDVLTITASLNYASLLDVTIPLTFGGTATLTSDYTHSATSITIPAGSTTGSITLSVVDDVLDEDDETVIVSLGTGLVNAIAGTTSPNVTVTIRDNDAAPTVNLSASPTTMNEP